MKKDKGFSMKVIISGKRMDDVESYRALRYKLSKLFRETWYTLDVIKEGRKVGLSFQLRIDASRSSVFAQVLDSVRGKWVVIVLFWTKQTVPRLFED